MPFQKHFKSTPNHFKSTQNNIKSTWNHPKSTQNHLESAITNSKHVRYLKSIIIYPILAIVVAFSALETYQSIKSYQSNLSTIMALSARSNYHSCHLIFDIVESLSVRSWPYQQFNNIGNVFWCYYDQPCQSILIL